MFRILATTTILLALPFAHAGDASCPPGGDATLLDAAGVYVTPEGGVFAESNGVAGLQSAAGSCEDANGRTLSWTADTRAL